MTNLTFTYQDGIYISDVFGGNVNVQCVFAVAGRYPLVVETRLNSSMPWGKYKDVLVDTTATINLPDCSEGQQFRIKSFTQSPTASYDDIVLPGKAALDATLQNIDETLTSLDGRLDDLEEGNEPLVLSTNFDTGYLEQEGISSGNFDVDYETGYLTFEPNE